MQILPLVDAPGVLCGSATVNAVDGAGTFILVFVPPGIILVGSGSVEDVVVEFKDGGGVECKDGGGTLMQGSPAVFDVKEDESIVMVVTALTIGVG